MAVRRPRASRAGAGAFNVEVHGGHQLYDLSRRLKDAPKVLQREFRRDIGKAVKPLERSVRSHLSVYLPDRGGYVAELSRSLRIRAQQRGYYFASITLVATAKGRGGRGRRDLGALDRGVLRHPVFGRHRVAHRQGRFIPNPWVTQRVRSGFWTEPIEAGKADVRHELRQVMHRTAQKITKG